jgi:hypothetical protein
MVFDQTGKKQNQETRQVFSMGQTVIKQVA